MKALLAGVVVSLLLVCSCTVASAAGAAKCPAAIRFLGRNAGYWHHRYWRAAHSRGPSAVAVVSRTRRHTTFGCPASMSFRHGPVYWYHQLLDHWLRLKVVRVASRLAGTPYLFGGDGPGGFDCSGFVEYVYRLAISLRLPRTTFEQWRSHLGRPVARKALKAGDEVFFYPSWSGPDHAGIYIGGGRFIDAPHTGATVRVNLLRFYPEYVGARRYVR